ncbi:MAG: hypothetical protein AB8B71_18540 [Paracoccaceae bacterium]
MSVNVPLTLIDGSGFVWDIRDDGRIGDGSDDAFDSGLENPDIRPVATATLELDGRQVVLHPGTALSDRDVSLERRIYVPEHLGWARFIDTVTNVSEFVQTYSMRVTTNFGSDIDTHIPSSSDGDAELSAMDLNWVNDDGLGNDPAVGIAFSDGTRFADRAAYEQIDFASLSFDLSLDPGQSISILSFATQGDDAADVSTQINALSGPVTEAMEFGIPHWLADTIVNYDVNGFFEQTAYFGNEFNDTLLGSVRAEQFDAQAGDDVVLAAAGADTVRAGAGDDVVEAGAGDDVVLGGGGHDLLIGGDGADALSGDGDAVQRQVQTTGLSVAGGPVQISISMPLESQQTQIEGDIYVSRFGWHEDGLNLVYLLDVSASMNSENPSSDWIADRNGDGLDNRLIDHAIAGFDSLTLSFAQAGVLDADLRVIAFDSGTQVVFDGVNGIAASFNWDTAQVGGSARFEGALQASIDALQDMGLGENHVFFLSDGAALSDENYLDEVATLRAPAGLDATIRAVGYGIHADLGDLDLVDDGLSNGSVQRVDTAVDVTGAFLGDVPDGDMIVSASFFVNGIQVQSFAGEMFSGTSLGSLLNVQIDGLTVDDTDQVTLDLLLRNGETLQFSLNIAEGTASPGDDILRGEAGADALAGNGGADQIFGGDASDLVHGGSGNDQLYGGIGDDTLFGGTGDDFLQGGAGADVLIGGEGVNWISYAGSVGAVDVDLSVQSVSGGDANGDQISGFSNVQGTSQDDVLTGTEARNMFRPGLGSDTVFGGAEVDFVDYSDVGAGVIVRLKDQGKAQDTGGAGADLLRDIDALIGSQFDDFLVGDSGFNELRGGAGNDVLRSKGGNDRMFGDAGDDTIEGDTGNELISGGVGDDNLNGLRGTDTIYGGAGDDYISGGRDADVLHGQGGADILRGNIGHDTIFGDRGADNIKGGAGQDRLYGGGGDDYLTGENGDDTLSGGSGSDVLLGAGGFDVFELLPGMDFEELRDFVSGEDVIDVSAFELTGFTELQSLAEDRAVGLRIDFGEGDAAFVTGLSSHTLNEIDFVF